MEYMDRRDFLKFSATGIFSLGMASEIKAAEALRIKKPRRDSYSVVILGDTHYDTAPDTVYHTGYSDPNPTREANHRKEFARNAEMWSDRLPRLTKRAACLIDRNTRFAFQTGDLIQGDTGNVLTHKLFLDDAFNMLKDYMGPLPLVTVAGNHDYRAKNDAEAVRAYKEYMPARLSSELGVKVDGSDFSFRVGPDAYIAVDFTITDDEKVARLVEEAADARYIFILCHAPVFPYDSAKYSNWYYHGRDKSMETRNRMLKLFAKHNVIVLCGHTHTTEILDWRGYDGRISQMTMNSVWSTEKTGVYNVNAHGAEEYGKLLLSKLDAGDDEKAKAAAHRLFDEFRPGIRQYSRSAAAGSYKLNVSDEGVTVDFYVGDSTRVTETFVLR